MSATATRSRREVDSRSITPEQPSDVHMPADGEFKRPDDSKIALLNGAEVTTDYYDEIQFMESPVTVIFQPSSQQFAPPFVDCFCQGKGIEVLMGDRWVEWKQVPVGESVTVKRKYLDIIGRAKETILKTKVVTEANKDPQNTITRTVVLKHPFSVQHDPHPRGAKWLMELLSAR